MLFRSGDSWEGERDGRREGGGRKGTKLKVPFLIGSERLPLWRVQELVREDVVEKLTLQRHTDPRGRKGGREVWRDKVR